MALYCKVTNTTTRVCSMTVQTQYYRTIRLNAGEEVFIADAVCNRAGLAAIGFQVEEVELPDQGIAFGQAHDRIMSQIFEERQEHTAWIPANGYPTWDSVGYEFPPGTIFESSATSFSTIPSQPTPITIQYRQRIQNLAFDPDGVTSAQWRILPRDADEAVTVQELADAVASLTLGTAVSSPNYKGNFIASDWIGGVYSVPLTTHGLPFTSGQVYEVEVFNPNGGKLWACTATNPMTGEVTITTDGVSFPGSLIISES